MQKMYLSTTQWLISAIDGSAPASENGPIEIGDPVRLVVPRWLAEACKFELDHEHDDELAEVDS